MLRLAKWVIDFWAGRGWIPAQRDVGFHVENRVFKGKWSTRQHGRGLWRLGLENRGRSGDTPAHLVLWNVGFQKG